MCATRLSPPSVSSTGGADAARGDIACLLADSDGGVRYEAGMTLGKLDHATLKPYVGAIVGLLTDSNEGVRGFGDPQ